MDLRSFPMGDRPYLFDQNNIGGRNTEMVIMSCTNGSDGYPAQAEFNRRMESYIARKKRSERTVVSEEELAGIHGLLSDPSAMRAEADVSHRTWVKKTFMLKSFVNGIFVCHKDKGQVSAQPIASKEKMYFILKQAHASEGHGGRDKTAKAVKKTHSFIRKGLICLFLEVCPTCRARNDAAKKDKLANTQTTAGDTSPLAVEEPAMSSMSLAMWGRSQSPFHHHHNLHPQQQNGYYMAEDGQRLFHQLPGMVVRRAPTTTEAGCALPQFGPGHLRSHTYPFLDGNYSAHLNMPETSARGMEPQSPTVFQPFNAQLASGFPFAVPQPAFGPPSFPMQVDHPTSNAHIVEREYSPTGSAYYPSHQPQIQHQTTFTPSNNIYDAVNGSFFLNHAGGSGEEGGSLAIANFDPQPLSSTEFCRDNLPSNLAMKEQLENLLSSSTDIGHQIRSADNNGYGFVTPFDTKDSVSPEPSSSAQSQGTAPRTDKNHKQLSLLTSNTSQNPPRSVLHYPTSSVPSTAGSLWTTADDLSTPMLTSSLHNAISAVSLNPHEFGDDPAAFPSR